MTGAAPGSGSRTRMASASSSSSSSGITPPLFRAASPNNPSLSAGAAVLHSVTSWSTRQSSTPTGERTSSSTPAFGSSGPPTVWLSGGSGCLLSLRRMLSGDMTREAEGAS